jgi:hypothetical protein
MELLSKAFNKLNINKLFSYSVQGEISSVGALTELKFKTNSTMMWCFYPFIVLYDSNGKVLNFSDEAYNYFLVNIKELTGGIEYTDNLMTVAQWNRQRVSKQYSGMLMNSNTNFVVQFQGQSTPSTSINLNYVAKAFFIGYNLGYGANYKAEKVRENLLEPYTQTLNLTISGVGGDTQSQNNTIRTTQNGQFINVISCDIIDADGNVITENDYQDIIYVNLTDDDNNIILKAIPHFALNWISTSERFKGFYLKPQSNYYVNIVSENNSNITSQTLNIDTISGNFAVGETITGGTSSATAVIVAIKTKGGDGYLIVNNVVGAFVNAEAVAGGTSGATADVVGTIGASPMKYPLKANIGFLGCKQIQYGRNINV